MKRWMNTLRIFIGTTPFIGDDSCCSLRSWLGGHFMSFDRSPLMSQQLCLSIISTEHRASPFSPGVVFITSNESLHPASQSNKTKLVCDVCEGCLGTGDSVGKLYCRPGGLDPCWWEVAPSLVKEILSLPSCEGAMWQGRYWPGPLAAPGAAHLQFSLQHPQTRAQTKTAASRSIRTRSLHDATFCREISQTSIYQVAIVSSAAA